MSAKPIFSRADVAAINARIARYSTSPLALADLARAPSSPVAAKVLREIGISREKLNEAFRIALMTVDSEK
jgi:hypothetical protein